jgi:[ribosomal protein S5]-alanine N-acetyltransferase
MCVDIDLARPSPADADEFIAAALQSAALHRPWVTAPDTPERFTAYLNRAGREDRASYLVRHRACGALVGYVNINNIVLGTLRSGHLGYASFLSHARRGLMAAGLAGVVTDAFTTLGLHRLEANIQPGNAPSLNLVRRLGFRREGFSPRYLLIDGQWCDHERWTVLAEDWAVLTADERPIPSRVRAAAEVGDPVPGSDGLIVKRRPSGD